MELRNYFDVILLEGALDFLDQLDLKTRTKIYYNLRKVRAVNDPKLFKKLSPDIWEFRTLYAGLQYRLLAFWDREDCERTLVLVSHGIVKKRSKVPKLEIEKAEHIRAQYFEQKNENDENE